MEIIFEFFKHFNIILNNENETIVLLLSAFFVLLLIGTLSIINIGIYILALYITNHKLFLEKISKWPILVKYLNIYRKTRVGFIMFEICMFLFCQGCVLWLCLRIITNI